MKQNKDREKFMELTQYYSDGRSEFGTSKTPKGFWLKVGIDGEVDWDRVWSWVETYIQRKVEERVKKLHQEEMEGIVQNEYHNGFEDGFEEAERRTEGVFKKMGLDEKFMEFLEDSGATFITTKKERK